MQYLLYALGVLVAIFLLMITLVGIACNCWMYWQIIKAARRDTEKPQSVSDTLSETTVALVPRYCKGRVVKGQWLGIYVKQSGAYKYAPFEGVLETEEKKIPLAAPILRWLKLRYFSARGEDAMRDQLVRRPPPFD